MKSYCCSVNVTDFFPGKLVLLRGVKATVLLFNIFVVDLYY